jgi:hypothetical protein
MTVLCAWCKVVIHEGAPGLVSHGICAACASAQVQAEYPRAAARVDLCGCRAPTVGFLFARSFCEACGGRVRP